MNWLLLDFYRAHYEDPDGCEMIDPNATFQTLFDYLDFGKNVYELCGDSVVRERLFERLAELIEAPYDYIYTQWITRGGRR